MDGQKGICRKLILRDGAADIENFEDFFTDPFRGYSQRNRARNNIQQVERYEIIEELVRYYLEK